MYTIVETRFDMFLGVTIDETLQKIGHISAVSSHTSGLVRGQSPSGRTSEFTSYRQSKSGQRLGVWIMAFLEIAKSGLPSGKLTVCELDNHHF